MAFTFLGIADYHAQLLRGDTSVAAVVDHYLAAIADNASLNAMVTVRADEARSLALELDASLPGLETLPPLFGVVVAVKEVICIRDCPTTASSAMLQGHRPVYHATVVQRLLDAGAIIIGTCSCDEFAMGSSNENSIHGPVHHALDPTRVPGGSSGGSAVAVQAGLCMVSLGSDTGGSVRQPADFCGIWGLKPTYGAVSRYGLIAYASSFDCIGVFGRHAADVYQVFGVMAGADDMDGTCMAPVGAYPQTDLPAVEGSLRLAVLEPTITLPGLDAEIRAAFEQTEAQLQAAGHTVDRLPFDLLDYIVPTYYVLTTAEASSNLGRYDGIRYGLRQGSEGELTKFYAANRSAGFGAEVKRRIMLGSFVLSAGFYDAYFTKAQQVRQRLVALTNSIFEGYHGILMPVSPTTAWHIGEKSNDPVSMYLADIYTVFANLTGLPGLAFPMFQHSNGMPFGLQLLAKPGDEVLLHRMAKTVAGFGTVAPGS